MYDLIVVGGGAIGLFLAKEFQEKGNSVLVLEKKKEPQKKVCSGLVSSKIFDYLPGDIKGKSEFNIFFEKKFSGARLWVGNSIFDFKGEAWLFDRSAFNNFLFQEATKSKIEIKTGKEIAEIREESDCVEVVLKTGEILKSKILAGCDGLPSFIAGNTGFPRQKNSLLGVITYTKKQDYGIDLPELFFEKKFPGFFAWRIPRKDCVEWGLALNPKKKPREKLEKFLKEKKIHYGKFEAALIPSYPLRKTISKRIFLCGDAAGHIKPMTGGGLIYGFRAARIAAEIINFTNPNLEIYEKAWRRELMKEIKIGNFLRKCYSCPSFIKKAGLNYLKNRQKLHQDKPTSIF